MTLSCRYDPSGFAVSTAHWTRPTWSRLVVGEVQQPVPIGADQRVPAGAVPAVQGEDDATLVAVVLLPPAGVGDRLVGVVVPEMVERVVGHGDRQPVLAGVHRQPARH